MWLYADTDPIFFSHPVSLLTHGRCPIIRLRPSCPVSCPYYPAEVELLELGNEETLAVGLLGLAPSHPELGLALLGHHVREVGEREDGADEGRTVDDITASGANYRTRIREKLDLPSLDDFVAMVRRVAELFPESAWGPQMFFKLQAGHA